jgi:hypothetical protein
VNGVHAYFVVEKGFPVKNGRTVFNYETSDNGKMDADLKRG